MTHGRERLLSVDIALSIAGPRVQVRPLEPGAATEEIEAQDLPRRVAELDRTGPRWIWADTAAIAPRLLAAGVSVGRCLDLRLCHAILHRRDPSWGAPGWDEPRAPASPLAPAEAPGVITLLDDLPPIGGQSSSAHDKTLPEVIAEYESQQAQSGDPRVRLLLAAESVGALIAAEIHHHGLPWDVDLHNDLLTAALGPRPREGTRPALLEALAAQIRTALDSPTLNPDSHVELLRVLRGHGLDVKSTSKWEITGIDHPVVAPLLEYKRLARLLSANGWAWLDSWVAKGSEGRRGRFRPDYVPGGVVTGRWATSGGGALQLPKQLRPAVRADPGWALVVADAAQIEPRVLAAMAGDRDLARAGRGGDLYQGLVDEGVMPSRDQAKVAMLGALYGGTSGDSGLLMPRLLRAYPRATAVVENAARTGERGGVVSTWLGRTSPPPSDQWQRTQREAGTVDAGPDAERTAARSARDWGRFTRNFVVQGTAAEWALCWMGEIRRRLRPHTGAHLVFFMHDEVIVHCPAEAVEAVTDVVAESAAAAGRLLFGDTEVDFPLSISAGPDYAKAG